MLKGTKDTSAQCLGAVIGGDGQCPGQWHVRMVVPEARSAAKEIALPGMVSIESEATARQLSRVKNGRAAAQKRDATVQRA